MSMQPGFPPRQHRTSLCFGMALGLLCATAAHADDTEVLVQVLPHNDPNVLLIFDTSGSMNSEVVVGEDYDPAISYVGSCTAGRVYYTRQTSGTFQLPDCPGQTSNWVQSASLVCDPAQEALSGTGYYTDQFAQWNDDPVSRSWFPITIANSGTPTPGQDRLTECASDFGLHGDGTNQQFLWPRNGTEGPWTDQEDLAIDWSATGDNYTLYDANYLNWIESSPQMVVKTRMQVLQEVASDLLTSVGGVRLGLMRFSSDGDGGMITSPVTDIATNRNALIAAVNAMEAGGQTPLAETLYEAGQYFGGREVFFGTDSVGNDGISRPSHPAAINGENYESPIIGQCQDNFVVLLTDGMPTNDSGANSRIQSLPGFQEATGAAGCTDSCLDELAVYLNVADQASGFAADQTVGTYTIGFHTDQELLSAAATALKPGTSDPGYYTANDTAGLQAAFTDILQNINFQSNSFAAPSVSADSFNRLTNRDEVYFTMFVPSGQPHWVGNLKKYGFRTDETGQLTITDANDPPGIAVDSATGLFDDNAISFWSSEVDGGDASAGGLRSRMTATRTIYTDTQDRGENLRLTSGEAEFHEDNSRLTASLLGVDESEREALIKLLRGVDENGDVQPIFGDPLHTQPIVLTYGGTADAQDTTVFITTNDGYFHAVNPNPSSPVENLELFAFIPHAMLPRLKELRDNDVTAPIQKGYGLDGTITSWIDEDDGDFVIDNGEKAYVFFGMRRGGRNYYGLEVSRRDEPRLQWTIEGGIGDFVELGQSWSAATVSKIRHNGAEKTVLIFGGGYDTVQDVAGAPVSDSVGRAVYIVDAETGDRLWWAANAAAHPSADLPLAGMNNSIPSDVRVIDTNLDGLADRLYVGDTGAKVWRFDINNAEANGSQLSVSGGVIGDFSDGEVSGNRRFYYPPSVAQVIDERVGSFLTVSIGTGHRANPLGTGVLDRFYMLRDPHVFGPLLDTNGNAVYNATTEAGLVDITLDTSPSIDILNASSGWMLRFVDSGEKVLASALTADNKIFFTTYLPGGVAPTCELSSGVGSGRLYSVDLISGAPVIYDDSPLPDDRYDDLERGGIPPAPIPVFTIPECEGEACQDPGDPDPDDPDPGDDLFENGCNNAYSQVTLLVATETRDPRVCNAPKRTYWHEVDIDR